MRNAGDEMNNPQYDDVDVFERKIDFGDVPENLNVPLSVYGYEVDDLPPTDLQDLSLNDAIGALTPGAFKDVPEMFNDSMYFEEAQVQTPISQFLLAQISQIDAEAKAKNPDAEPIDLQTAFPKNTQTQWFTEFNKSALENNEIGKKLISKVNGFFFKGDEDPKMALGKLGIKPDLIEDYAEHFEMSYFGNTRSRTKNNSNENGFKSYVMHLKDPTNERSLEILNEVIAAKQQLVQAKLDKSYDLDKAVEIISARADTIINEEVQKTGVTPFVGTPDRLFLSPSALYAEINEKAPELKGLYSIEPLDSKGNKITYSGYSEGLESYFEDDLKICKLTTKNPEKLSQQDLENIVAEKIELGVTREHVAETPTEALIQQIEGLSNEIDSPKPDSVKSNDTKALDGEDNSPLAEGSQRKFIKGGKSQDRQYGDEDQSHFNRRKRKNDVENEEPDSLAKITLDAFSKISQATLAAVVALAKLILQTIMALLKALARMVGMNVAPGSLLPDNPLLTFNNTLDRMRMTKGPAEDVENTKDLNPENAVSDLTEALEADIANDVDLKNEYELSDVKPLDKIKLSKEALDNLSIEDRARLDEQADLIFKNLTDEERQNYLKKIEVAAEHSFAEDLPSKLSEPLVYDDRFGVLLASSDKVEFNGNEYGVVSAAVVGGVLLYAIAKENEAGNYDVQFANANELTLNEHNAFNFDNFSNLKNHINEQLVEKFPEHEGKIEKLAIVDRQDLKGHEITIAELNNRTNFISFDKLGFDTSPISVDELIKDNPVLTNELFQSLPQLHQDKTGVLNASSKGNSHPFFGRVLDINDQVDCKLANSDITIRGAVIGAYESEAQLYYQVMHRGQFYSVKAEETSLIQPNGGDLTDEQISLISAKGSKGKEFRVGSIPVHHAATAHSIKLLSQKDENGFDRSFQYETGNNVVSGGGANIGVVPLEKDEKDGYVGGGRLISLISNSGEPAYFVTIGETINPANGMKRAVAFEVNNTLTGTRPKNASENRLVQLNLDDPNLNIVSAGLKNEDLKSFARQARQMYENGSLRRVANVVAHFANEAKARLLSENNEPLNIAREAFIQNKIAMGILQEEAGLTASIPAKDMGLNANLSDSTIAVDQVQKIIENPESRSYAPSQSDVTNNPLDLISSSEVLSKKMDVGSLLINDLIQDFSTQSEQMNVEKAATDITYQGVNLDQLNLVRVQRGLDGASVVDGKLVLQHKMEQEGSVRNTMHFALNGQVNDHAYGKFSDAEFAIIAPLGAVSGENTIGGISGADTWFHSKNNQVVLPNASIIVPNDVDLPKELSSLDINIIQYPRGQTPEETLLNRNEAINLELAERNAPQFNVNMHNWDGAQFSPEDQLAISQHFGHQNALPNNHDSSPDGELERSFSILDSLNQRKLNGETEYLNSNNGQWYRVDEKIVDATSKINETISSIENESVRQHYLDALETRIKSSQVNIDHDLDAIQAINMPEPLPPELASGAVPPPLPQEAQLAFMDNQDAKNFAILASAYVSGDPTQISDNRKALEILSERERLSENFSEMRLEADNFNTVLQSVGLIKHDNLSEDEIGFAKQALSNETVALHLNNLRDTADDFSIDYADHIGVLNKQLMKVSENIEFSSLDEQSLKSLSVLQDTLKGEIQSHVHGVEQVQGLIQRMDYIRENTPEAIQQQLPNLEVRKSPLAEQIDKLDAVFTTHHPQNSSDVRKDWESDLGNSY